MQCCLIPDVLYRRYQIDNFSVVHIGVPIKGLGSISLLDHTLVPAVLGPRNALFVTLVSASMIVQCLSVGHQRFRC